MPQHFARSRLPRWLLPAALGVVGVAATVGAVMLNGDDTAAALHPSAATTPVLSARRAPEVIAAPVADRRLAADLESWIVQSPPDSCLVVEANDHTLYAHNPTTPLAGASTQKLITSTALLLAQGPDARLDTIAGATVPVGAGVLAGDLYLVGGGDPVLSSPDYAATLNHNHGAFLAVDPAQLADAIVAAGVTRIEGSVVGDDTRYDAQRYNPAWPSRYGAQNIIGPVGALTVNDGFTELPKGGPSTDPAAHAAAVLTELLGQRGVAVSGAPRSGQAPAGLTTVADLPSPTVREIIAEMLTDSDNDTAEMAIKEIGASISGSGTWEAGAAAVRSLISQAGVALDGVNIVDGSGLSDTNRLTCQLLTDLLTQPETGPVLVQGLAVAGVSGTLVDRGDGTVVEGRIRAKTGTLQNVTALSGRAEPAQGGTLTFSYVANVPGDQAIDSATVNLQNGLTEILVSYPRGVDINALVPVAVATPPPPG
jgi:D-alanyl-D-alanine carboxypeptidase/D-alanyl-D-alanine-endopeptidase (penicillin-binding protein 4)